MYYAELTPDVRRSGGTWEWVEWLAWQQSSGDWMVQWRVKRRPGDGARGQTQGEGLTQTRHKVNIFPKRYCELGIWLNVFTEKQKGQQSIHKLFWASKPSSLPIRACVQTKSIWKLLCDDLFPTTCNLAHFYICNQLRMNTTLDKESGQWCDNNMIETYFRVAEGRNSGTS